MAKHSSISAAIEEIEKFFLRKIEEIDNHIGNAVYEAGLLGRDTMKEIITTTTSPTGEERASRGGQPGRIDTSNMIDAVQFDAESTGDLAHRVHKARWGWLDGEHEEYFLIQEYGPQWFDVVFKAMGSLQGSHTQAREQLRKDLDDL